MPYHSPGECLGGVDGHIGYRRGEGTSLIRLVPDACPQGHPLRYGTHTIVWVPPTGWEYICTQCSAARERKPSWVMCLCRSERYLDPAFVEETPLEMRPR